MDDERVDEVMVGATSGLWRGERLLDPTPVYGVTWDGQSVYVGQRSMETGGGVERWSPSLERLEVVKALVRDVHQMLWAGGWLYWTNTHEDALEAWNGDAVALVYDAGGSGEDRNHLNSVWADPDGHLWVVLHGRGEDASRVRCLDTGWERAFDTTNLHNVYVEDGRVHVLAGSRVLAAGLDGGRVEELARVPEDGYLRGLARGDGLWAVGRSLASPRHEREGGDGHVLLFDDGWNEINRLTLPGAGQVHEVRLLDGDRAHNGLPYPGELP